MPRESSFHCVCWEIGLKPDELDGLLANVRKRSPGVIVQIFRTTREPNLAAIEMIAAQTLTAVKSGSTLAERPELDLLLRLAGTRQIGEAFRRAGYKSGGKKLLMVAASEGDGNALARLGQELAGDKRFSEVARKELSKEDMEQVELAALLAVRL